MRERIQYKNYTIHHDYYGGGHNIFVFPEKIISKNGVPYGIRTRVAAVKGRCPRPLDERDIEAMSLRGLIG